MITVKVTGLKELQEKLEELGTKEAKAIVRSGLTAMSTPVLKEMKAEAPRWDGEDEPGKPPGFLAAHINRKVKFFKDALAGVVLIGPQTGVDYPGSPTARLTRKGTQRAGKPVWLIAQLMEFGSARNAAHPFIKPTWDKLKGSLTDIFASKVKERLHL